MMLQRISTLLVLSALALSLIQCQKNKETNTSDPYVLPVESTFPIEGTVYLHKIYFQNLIGIDSIVLHGEKSFQLKAPSEGVQFYRISINQKASDLFVLDERNIKIGLDGTQDMPVFSFKNSPLTDQYKSYRSIDKGYQLKAQELNKSFVQFNMQKDSVASQKVLTQFQALQDEQRVEIKQQILKNGPNVVSVFATTYLDLHKDFMFMDSLAQSFKDLDSEHELVKKFVADINKQKNTAKGAIVPEFTLKGAQGKDISIRDFKGKVVLIDFWASWCGPCRMANPRMVALFQKYKSKGFTVLGVSLDTDENKWKEAIMKDQLTWPHVSDLKGWDSKVVGLFNIEGIPFTMLLDQEGKIIGTNLSETELEEKIASLCL